MTEYTGTRASNYNFRTFNLNNSNNTGSREIEDKNIWVYRAGKFIREMHSYSDSLIKLIDEIITNAVDALICPPNGTEFGKAGNRIDINLNKETGAITVINNGPGIPLYKEEKGTYSIEGMFSREYTSTNYDYKKDSYTGGINGVGAKITNILSDYFIIETVCYKSAQKYIQKFSNNMEHINPPIIETYKGQPYTKIEFLLSYDIICKEAKLQKSEGWYEKNRDLVYLILERRAWEASIYLNGIGSVYFCNKCINTDLKKFASMHCTDEKIFITNINNIKIACIIHEPILVGKKYEPKGFRHISMMNGVALTATEPPNYILKLINKIEKYILSRPDFTKYTFLKPPKVLPDWIFYKNITFITITQYYKRHFDFVGQNKSTLSFSKNSLAEFDKTHVFGESFLENIWSAIKNITIKIGKPVNKNTKAKPKLYEPATCVKSGKQGEALIIVEGDSAATLIRAIFELNPSIPRDKYGLYSIQGVPINSIKHSTKYPQGYLQDEKLKKNDNIQALVNVLGISYAGGIEKCKYKKIIIATDQDFDGKGKICSLLIGFFITYFPQFIKEGRVYRYRTPIVRAQLKNELIDFYSISEFDDWVKNIDIKNIKTSYYKGLGTHDEDDIKKMAGQFMNDLVKINYNDLGEILLYQLYDKDTTIRKTLLTEYCDREYKYQNDLDVSLEEHCLNESIPEQVNNITRMIPSVIDGMVPCQRKIFVLMRTSAKIVLVSGLAGKAIDKMNYAHGPVALGTSIKGMAQIFVGGGNRCPLILPVSASIGTQFGGTKDTAQDRYTKVKSNPLMKYLYPIEDDDLLELIEEEGHLYEPINYVPIMPRILLEDYNCIGTGWNCVFYARRFDMIYKYIKHSIIAGPVCSELMGLPQLYNDMEVIIHEGREICIGKYRIEGRNIYITQLPLQIWGKKIMKMCDINYEDKKSKKKSNDIVNKFKDIVEDINNKSGIKIEICITLQEGALERIVERAKMPYLDPIIEYFGLYKYLYRNLNFVVGSKLKSYNNLNEIFSDWFYARKNLYKERIKKLLVRLKYKIILNESILYFVQNDTGEIDNKDDEERDLILSKTSVQFIGKIADIKTYIKLNEVNIKNKIQGSAQALEEAILKDASYNYIYNIKKSATSIKNIEKQKLKVEALYKEYNYIINTTWRELWLRELKEYKKKYQYCIEKNWYYKNINF